jgi:hypothetical protein
MLRVFLFGVSPAGVSTISWRRRSLARPLVCLAFRCSTDTELLASGLAFRWLIRTKRSLHSTAGRGVVVDVALAANAWVAAAVVGRCAAPAPLLHFLALIF